MKPLSKTYLKVVTNIVMALIVILFCIFILPKCILFFMPFIIGWIISLIAAPIVRFFEEKLKVKRKAVSAIVIIAVLAAVIMLVYGIGSKVVKEVLDLLSEMPDIWESIQKEFGAVGANLDGVYSRMPKDMQVTLSRVSVELSESLGNWMSNAGSPTLEAVGNVAKHIPDIFLGTIICILASYFFVADKSYMSDAFKKYVPDSVRYRFDLIRRSFRKAIGGYFKAQFKIELWVYILLVIGFAILGVRYALLVALGIAFLDFLPVFGTGTVMLPWALIELLGKNYKMMFGLLALWLIGQLVRQIIQPKIVGDSIGMDAIPTLFLLYIGYRFAGVVGMILAVPIGIILINLYEEGTFKTTQQSIQILVAGFNHFRKIGPEDLEVVDNYEREAQKNYQERISNEPEESGENGEIRLERPELIKKIKTNRKKNDVK